MQLATNLLNEGLTLCEAFVFCLVVQLVAMQSFASFQLIYPVYVRVLIRISLYFLNLERGRMKDDLPLYFLRIGLYVFRSA